MFLHDIDLPFVDSSFYYLVVLFIPQDLLVTISSIDFLSCGIWCDNRLKWKFTIELDFSVSGIYCHWLIFDRFSSWGTAQKTAWCAGFCVTWEIGLVSNTVKNILLGTVKDVVVRSFVVLLCFMWICFRTVVVDVLVIAVQELNQFPSASSFVCFVLWLVSRRTLKGLRGQMLVQSFCHCGVSINRQIETLVCNITNPNWNIWKWSVWMQQLMCIIASLFSPYLASAAIHHGGSEKFRPKSLSDWCFGCIKVAVNKLFQVQSRMTSNVILSGRYRAFNLRILFYWYFYWLSASRKNVWVHACC